VPSPERRFLPLHVNLDPCALEALRAMSIGPKRLGVVLSQIILQEVARREERARHPEQYAAALSRAKGE
jgi:hypothetical protein